MMTDSYKRLGDYIREVDVRNRDLEVKKLLGVSISKEFMPSIEQQQKIVSEYETVTRRIRLNEQIIAKLEETAQTLYRKMFVNGIDKKHLPEGWRMGTLEMLCELIIAGTIPVYSDESQYLGIRTKMQLQWMY